MIARHEPRGQRLLVNLLFGAAVAVAVLSLLGEVIGLKGMLGKDAWFWFGHQGWTYLELGRFWQILLFAGMIFWLVIVYRGMIPILHNRRKNNCEEASDSAAGREGHTLTPTLSREGRGENRRQERSGHAQPGDFLLAPCDPGGGVFRVRAALRWQWHDGRGLLAMVRGAYLGREHLRVLRHRGGAVPGDAGAGWPGGAAGGLPDGHPGVPRRDAGICPTITFGPAGQVSGWQSARCSARSNRSR